MSNLAIYNQVRTAPKEALKPIQAGRLKGKSDINPMWRIKALTELFGPCGVGWKYAISKQWLEQGAKGEIAAFTNIDLYVKHEGEWSEAIPGTGGSMYVANEKNGPYVSDECFKMSLTDAISVACKALGVAADVYWDSDRTKYDKQGKQEDKPKEQQKDKPSMITQADMAKISSLMKDKKISADIMQSLTMERYKKGKSTELTHTQALDLIKYLGDSK